MTSPGDPQEIGETISVCSRCQKRDARPDVEANTPPVGWATLTLSYRAAGHRWSEGGKWVERVLCPECAGDVERLIEAKG